MLITAPSRATLNRNQSTATEDYEISLIFYTIVKAQFLTLFPKSSFANYTFSVDGRYVPRVSVNWLSSGSEETPENKDAHHRGDRR
jgi:hypothetical protein